MKWKDRERKTKSESQRGRNLVVSVCASKQLEKTDAPVFSICLSHPTLHQLHMIRAFSFVFLPIASLSFSIYLFLFFLHVHMALPHFSHSKFHFLKNPDSCPGSFHQIQSFGKIPASSKSYCKILQNPLMLTSFLGTT